MNNPTSDELMEWVGVADVHWCKEANGTWSAYQRGGYYQRHVKGGTPRDAILALWNAEHPPKPREFFAILVDGKPWGPLCETRRDVGNVCAPWAAPGRQCETVRLVEAPE